VAGGCSRLCPVAVASEKISSAHRPGLSAATTRSVIPETSRSPTRSTGHAKRPTQAASLGRLIDIAEMNSEEKSVLQPMMTSVAANDTHSGCGRGSRSD
jgi:hypothetical protein